MKNCKSLDLNMIDKGSYTLNQENEEFTVNWFDCMKLMKSSNVLLRTEFNNPESKSRNALLNGVDITTGEFIGKMLMILLDHLIF